MIDWLGVATQLAQAKSHAALSAALREALAAAFSFRDTYLFTVTTDGRQLACVVHKNHVYCSVTDFASPLAHVLQQGEEKLITASDLPYWHSDVLFKQVFKHLPDEHAILMTPLRTHASSPIFAVLVSLTPYPLILNSMSDTQQEVKTHYAQLLSLFAHHWQSIILQQTSQAEKGLLADSLSAAHKMQQQVLSEQSLASKLIGQSACMHDLRAQVAKAAYVTKTVLIEGEIGVGKSAVAEQIHQCSPQQAQPWMVVNCAHLGAFRLERALFGYAKGAFEGATQAQIGAFGAVKSGTLYLEDVDHLPLALQAKLMQVLCSGTYQQLGSQVELPVHFRLIASTTKKLRDCVHHRTFRQDLFYRLYQFPIQVPTLAQRKEDIHALANCFVKQFNSAHHAHISGVHYQTIEALTQVSLDGNVRELQSIIEFGCTHVRGTQPVMLKHIEQYLKASSKAFATVSSKESENRAMALISNLPQAVKEYEKEVIAHRLKNYSGNRALAAKSLGIPKRTLADKCSKMEIDV